ncbi:hypothetical protein ABB37_04272 [Leptomonas pyrrhocoris]|uniref:Uncharacterized protein n=1 Tax=Leptomonas pyrrhocoris TaxID=157538 RepID=A0A0M9G245_LEPPY|nr:hypothetical protein ABB37_04272 [Leptomonas pyrrhocoris]KPA80850.1 hypothetical protein ABB37_04272 [Leptomonas pyrrhocoris]|eukprot:XP_015659289.1 hypothetical protein ABB37_04272 [Leptomonas pyrrhocoris]
MSVLESSSYLAYLRDVARSTTNASIVASVSAAARPPRHHHHHHHRSPHHRHREGKPTSAHVNGTSDVPDDTDTYAYEYDYVREPPLGVLRGRSSRSSSSFPNDSKPGRARESAVRLHDTAKHTHTTTTAAAASTANTKEKGKEPLQTSFQQMYAALQEIGRQEMDAAATSRQTIHGCYRSSPSSTMATGKHGKHQHDRRVQFTAHASSHGAAPSSCGCFQHSWDASPFAIRVPPPPPDDNGDGEREVQRGARTLKSTQSAGIACSTAVMSGAKVLASTDTSALTSSPTKLTSSSSSSDTSSCLMAGASTRLSPYQQRHLRSSSFSSSSRHAVRFTCPYCCRRCDSCRCAGRPCQLESRRASPKHAADRLIPLAATPSPRSRQRCRAGPEGAHLQTPPPRSRQTATSPFAARTDAVRLQWPNQPEVHESHIVPASSARAASPIRQHRHRVPHGRNTREAEMVEKENEEGKASARKKEEAVLREVAQRLCTCYWADFPDVTMAINPASHATACAYQAQHALYDELMERVNDSDGAEEDAAPSSTTHASALRSPHSSQEVGAAQRARGAAAPSADDAVSSAVAHRQEHASLHHHPQHQQQQRRRWLAEEAAAAKENMQGRAAVIGTSQRRTYMEEIMAAARDAPSPAKAAAAATATTTARTKDKSPSPPQQQQQQTSPKDGPSPSPTSIVDVTVTPTTTSEAAAPPPPPPLLPEPSAPPTSNSPSEAPEEEEKAVAAPAETHREPPLAADDGVEAGHRDDDKAERADTTDQPTPTPTADEVAANKEEAATNEDEGVEDALRALSRPRQRPAVGVPGPGAYHVDVAYAWSSAAHGVRGAAIPKAARMPLMKSITPGPGAYNLYDAHRAKDVTEDVHPDKEKTKTEEAGEREGSAGDAAAQAKQPAVRGSSVVFRSTSARQFQLQFGSPYQRDATWAQRAAALPGPGSYNIVDGDRIDQSRPLGSAKLGFQFAKSLDGAHFTGFSLAGEATGTTTEAAAAAAVSSTKTEGAVGVPFVDKPRGRATAAFVVPWRDWAGGAYIGTSTADFWAHPSLAGGGRRVLPRREGVEVVKEEAAGDVFSMDGEAAAADAARRREGGVWHGVGSGVALRLTSLRFPGRNPSPPPPSFPPAATTLSSTGGAADNNAGGAGDAEPGPGSYETAAALRFTQRRAPAVSMTFKHDRGPRGPLQSTTAAAAAASGVDGSGSNNEGRSAALPGPGTYDVVVSDAWGPRRSPQWSFGTATRMPYQCASSPAALAGAAAAITAPFKGAFADAPAEEMPGPGAYNTEAAYRAVQPSAATAVIGFAPRFPHDSSSRDVEGGAGEYDSENPVPGPGAYDVHAAYERLHGGGKGGALPRATTRTRYDEAAAAAAVHDENGDERPGPGTYTLPPLPATGPTAMLGTTAPRFPWERTGLAKESDALADDAPLGFLTGLTPGPGAYDVDAAAQLARRPGTVIGRAPRSSLLVASEVGPGSYNLPALPAGRAALMMLSRDGGNAHAPYGPHDTEEPGPGLYDPVDVRAPAPRTVSLARTSARFADVATAAEAVSEDVPGPGAYDVEVHTGAQAARTGGGGGNAAAFGTAARFLHNSGGSMVGPGSYDPYLADAFVPAYSFPRGPRFSEGGDGSDADDDGGGGAGGHVGPGTYQIVDLSPLGRSAIMGTAAARPPLSYGEPAGYVNGAAVYSNSNGGGAWVPGPGAYSPQYAQVEKSAPQVVLARAVHNDGSTVGRGVMYGDTGSGLGPGQYDPQYPSDVHPYTFGSAPRAMNSGNGTGADGGGSGEAPGPGAYEVRVTRDGQLLDGGGAGAAGYHFGTAPRHAGAAGPDGASLPRSGADGDDVPGPGAYMPEAYTAMGTGYSGGAAAAKMGTAPRIFLTEEQVGRMDVPGPGAYMPEAYTDMGSRHLLGGGAAVAAAPRIGTAPRTLAGDADANVTATGPGPGAYEPNVYAALPAAPSITVPRAANRVGAVTTDTPGPGAYAPDNNYRYNNSSSNGSPVNDAGERAVHFGGAARFPQPAAASSSVDGDGWATPAPNAYSPVDASVRAAAPAHRFGTAAAHDDGRVYGSGASRAGEGAVFPSTSSFAFAAAMRDAGPGPGAYDANRADRWVQNGGGGAAAATAYRFGTAARFASAGGADAVDGAGIGPGAYDVAGGLARSSQMPTSASYSFPRASTHGAAADEKGDGGATSAAGAAVDRGSPGPGAYQLPPSFPEGPQWGFGTAPKHVTEDGAAYHEGTAEAAGVGPGSYALPPPPPLHSGVTVPRALTEHGGNDRTFPGPGAYDVAEAYEKSIAAGGTAAGGVRIGTAPRYPADSSADGSGARTGPGPGSYAPNIDAASSPSAAAATAAARTGPTFPHAARMPADADRKNGLDSGTAAAVGPGSYDLPGGFTTAAASSAARFGTAPRMPFASAEGAGAGHQTGEGVGPGSYVIDRADTQVLPRAPAHRIIAARDNGRDIIASAAAAGALPGPGSYDVPVEVQQHARAALLLGRSTNNADAAAAAMWHQTPGVGYYDLTHLDGSIATATAAAHRFGTAPTHRLPPTSKSVYDDNDGVREYGGAATPGPGAYDSAAAFHATQTRGSAGGFTMPGRPVNREWERRGEAPGPGAYDITTNTERGASPSHGFGTAPRMPAVGSSAREGGHSVGPGAYDTESFQQSASPSFTIPRGPRPALRAGDVDASPMVGPGSYTPADGFTKGKGAAAAVPTIGQAPRVWSTGNVDTPGPGSYDLPHVTNSSGPAAAAATFGTSQRPDPTAGRCDTPGPGAYFDASGLTSGPSGPSFSSAGRDDRAFNDNPGPGAYDGAYSAFGAAQPRGKGPLAATFTFAERASPVLNDGPGPGAYDATPSAPRGPAAGFGLSARPSPILHDNPGPGTYHILSSAPVGPAPSFGLGERPSPVMNSNPGPGAYYSMYAAPAGPAASFGYGERPSVVPNTNPGPGAYHREAYVAQLTGAVPAGVGFGRAERPSPVPNSRCNTPGPGTYYRERWTMTETNPPTFGLAARPSAVLNTNPGPGAYDNDDYRTARVDPPRGVHFGTSERPNAVLNTNPGPGTYFREGLGWSPGAGGSGRGGFGRAERASPVRGDTPGPGAYFREETEPSAATPTRAVSFDTIERSALRLQEKNLHRATTHRRATDGAAGDADAGQARRDSALRKRRKRPTAADTLLKLASVGYPLEHKP